MMPKFIVLYLTSGDHDAVGLCDNLVNVVDALLVLDLGDDQDVLASLAEDFPKIRVSCLKKVIDIGFGV